MSNQDPEATSGRESAARRAHDGNIRLVGGAIDKRVAQAKVPPLDLPHVLAPFRRPDDKPAFASFIAHQPIFLEVGFGRPHHLCDLAAARPDAHVVGFEIRRRWVQMAAKRAKREGMTNLVAIEGDARAYLEQLVPDGGLDAVFVLFPDPWWKKKHHKRRVFHADFVRLVAQRLRPGGMLIAKTDVAAYGDLIEEVVLDDGAFRLAGASDADPVLASLPRSHREKKCIELGIPYVQLRFETQAG